MKKKPTKKLATPRRKRVDQAVYEKAVYNQRCAYEEREKVSIELRRVNETAVRVYRLLEAERGELIARADKLMATMKAMELRVEDQTSPMSTRINRWT